MAARQRIAIIGSSHVAALKTGHDQLLGSGSLLDGYEVTFFASRRTTILNMAAQEAADGRLVLAPTTDDLRAAISHTSGGRAFVDFNDYDAVALVGLNRIPLCDVRTSSAARRAAFAGIARQSATARMLGWIRECSHLPVRAVPRPLPSMAPSLPPSYRPLPYKLRVAEINDYVAADDCQFVAQPGQTIAGEVATRPEFSVGSRRLDVGDTVSGLAHTENDLDHMNAAYGTHQLRALLADLPVTQTL